MTARAADPAESSRAWPASALLMAAAALAAMAWPPSALDWQPALAWREPWRWWSAAWVHAAVPHLGVNLVGLALVAAIGWLAPCRRADALAWWLATALAHLGLLTVPVLAHYGGLSASLHAALVIAALRIARQGRGARAWVGIALLAGLALKIALESPWQAAVRQLPGWDMPVAVAAHLSGALAGLAGALLVAAAEAASRARRRAAQAAR